MKFTVFLLAGTASIYQSDENTQVFLQFFLHAIVYDCLVYGSLRPIMSKSNPFRYFKTSPEIIRLAVIDVRPFSTFIAKCGRPSA